MNNRKVMDALWSKIILGDGASVRMSDGAEPDSGYMVAAYGYECRLHIGVLTREIVLAYVRALPGGDGAPGYRRDGFVGVWFDGDFVYLDYSVNIDERARALRIARYEHQLAVWDVAAKCEIRLNGGA